MLTNLFVSRLAIMISRIKISFQELRQAVIGMQEEKLGEQLIKQLLVYIPTSDEQEALSDYADNPFQLGKAEQFYLEVIIDCVEEKTRKSFANSCMLCVR
jgi:diaphanous 1